MSVSIYDDKNVVPNEKMLAHGIAETKDYFKVAFTFGQKATQ